MTTMSRADVSKSSGSKMTSSLSRLSKMDILAQKQNRIAEKKLSAAITLIDKERAVFKVNHRSLVQELRWELKDVRSSTGHSEQGRPPTSDELQRVRAWMPSRHSVVATGGLPPSRHRPALLTASMNGGGLPPLIEETRGGTPEHLYSDSDSEGGNDVINRAFDGGGVERPVRTAATCERASAAASSSRAAAANADHAAQQPNSAGSHSMAEGRRDAARSGSAESDRDDREGDAAAVEAQPAEVAEALDETLVAGKLEEMKRIMNMPTIYQTQELQKRRGLPRHVVTLPPIKFYDDDDGPLPLPSLPGTAATAAAVGAISASQSAAVASGGEQRLLPELHGTAFASKHGGGARAADDGSRPTAAKVTTAATGPPAASVVASTELAAELKRAKAAAAAAAAAVAQTSTELTKATSVGTVYKPKNIRLVGRSFTKAELVAQHRSLMEQSRSERDVNPARVQMDRLQSRVDAFLSSSSQKKPAGLAGAPAALPPVAVGAASGARLAIGGGGGGGSFGRGGNAGAR